MKEQFKTVFVAALVALLVSLVVVSVPEPKGFGVLSSKWSADAAGTTLTGASGATLSLASGSTFTSAATETHTGSVTNSGSQSFMTTTVGSGGVGTLTVHAATTMTDSLNMSNQVISNIGNSGTDFNASGGLTAADGFTGTVNTATQNSITKIGKQSTASVTGALNTDAALTAATGNFSTTLSIAGSAFTGAMTYGTAASYASGASITHGFATTPTVCMINPNQSLTTTYTITSTGFSSTMTTTGSPIYWICGK